MPLEDYSSGDEAWRAFSGVFRDEWERCPFKEELLAAVGGDLALARTIYGVLDTAALDWVDVSVPALDGLTPRQCLRTEQGGRRLREALLRFPTMR